MAIKNACTALKNCLYHWAVKKNLALINSSTLPLKGQMVHPLGEGAPGPPFGEIFAI